jgi:gas vesicle protein
MNNKGRTTLVFLTGLGIGAGLAALFTPRSGEETREWIAATAEQEFKVLRRMGRRSLRQLQDAVAEGEEKVTKVLRNGKKALGSVVAKLDSHSVCTSPTLHIYTHQLTQERNESSEEAS